MLKPKQGAKRKPLALRFWSRVEITPNNCWLWQGPVSTHGYGKIGMGGATSKGGKTELVHRLMFQFVYGSIPEGYQVDHLCHTHECGKTGKKCRHRRCVNPTHLQAVPHAVNTLRDGCTASAKNILKTHCPAGHEYTEENTRYEKTRQNRQGINDRYCRKCRECDRIRQAERRKLKKLINKSSAFQKPGMMEYNIPSFSL